jgi:spermidine synthase
MEDFMSKFPVIKAVFNRDYSVPFYLFIIGFISILGQVVILRELNVAFYGVELIYILAMGIWLFWTAVGAVIGRKKGNPSLFGIRSLFLWFGILLLPEMAFIRGIRLLLMGIPGGYLSFGQQLTALTLILLPIGLLLGLIFQRAAALYVEKEKNLAAAYAIESAGGLVGGLSSTLLLHFGVQNLTIAVLCGILTVSLIFLFQPPEQQGQASRDENETANEKFVEILTLLMLLFAFWLSPKIDYGMTRWNHFSLLGAKDSPYGRITVEGRAGQFVIFENDSMIFESESTAAEEFVHLAAIQHQQLNQVLICGGGVEGIITEILKHSPRKVDNVEINRVFPEMAKKHLPEKYAKSFESEGVSVYYTDPRKFLKNSLLYDLIFVGASAPDSGQSNRFYTLEFFRQCSQKLKPEGILAFRLRSSENLWTKFVTYRNASIYLALTSVFSNVLVLPGLTNIILASDAPLSRDPAQLIETFEKRKIETKLVTPAYIKYLLTNDRFLKTEQQLCSAKAVPNTDIQPICYQYAAMIWLSKFIPEIINRDLPSFGDSVYNIIISICAVLSVVLFFFARRRLRLKRILLVFTAAFIGMMTETMLMLHYQAKHGVLFQNIGILLMTFMGGLAAGSLVIPKAAKALMSRCGDIRLRLGISLLTGFGAFNFILIALFNSDASSGIFFISCLLFVSGFLVSGVFALASISGVEDQKLVISPLYAADLLGGCAASLLGSLFFIPFFGMETTAFIMAMLSLGALFFV